MQAYLRWENPNIKELNNEIFSVLKYERPRLYAISE